MGKYLLTFLTAAVGVVAAIFVTLLALSLTQTQTPRHSLTPWLIVFASALALLMVGLVIGAGIEGCRRWRTRKLSRLLSFGETLNEVALRIPRDNRSRILDFWRQYEDWCDSVVKDLPEPDRAHFQSLDLGQAPDAADFKPLREEQAYEVAGRVAVLRTIVKRLRGE